MAAALVQHASGTGATATTTASFAGATTSGNLVVLTFAADDYNGTPDTGWTQSSQMEQQTFHGGYLWWRISAGQTSFQYTIGSATVSAWTLGEFSGLTATPYDVSLGQFVQTTLGSYTTPSLTPTAGDRLLVGAIGTSQSGGGQGTPGTWTNSFTAIDGANNGTGAGTRDSDGSAYLAVTADGVTAYSTGASWVGGSGQSRSGLIIAFIVAGGGGATPAPDVLMAPMHR